MLKHHKDPRHLMTHEGRPALSLSFGAGNTLIVTYVTEAGSEVTVLDYGDRKLTWADVRREMQAMAEHYAMPGAPARVRATPPARLPAR